MSKDYPSQELISAERRDQMLNKIIDIIDRYGLYTPAAFFLTMGKPLAFLGSQAMFFAAPIAGVFVDEERFEDYAHLLSDRSNVDRLLDMMEEREQQGRKKQDNKK